jgi:hypothetical protein
LPKPDDSRPAFSFLPDSTFFIAPSIMWLHLNHRGNFMSEPTYEELKARLAELEKQGPKRTGSLEFRVSEKGGVSVYGLGRFPVTLYYEQWTRLLDATEKLKEFIEDNKSKLKLKDQ